MTASEAKDLMNGSMKHKGYIFKARLTWMCGKLNMMIENRAEHGYKTAWVKMKSEESCRIYFPLIAKYYEDLGFFVCYNGKFSWNNRELFVSWDFYNLTVGKQKEFLEEYRYHTKGYNIKEEKNEL